MLTKLISTAKKAPVIGPLVQSMRLLLLVRRYHSKRFVDCQPPGHFNSPVPDAELIKQNADRIFDTSQASLGGIDLREDAQLQLLDELSGYYGDLVFPEKPDPLMRFYFDNGGWCGHFDALVLHSFLRKLRPKRVIEVGSGFSSAMMLDTDERFLGGKVDFTFIDPYPARINSILRDKDSSTQQIIASESQRVPVERFSELGENDILFIDSSHVVKIGSDVPFLFFNVLPTLKPGVVIHVHDIFWPFEYPREWVLGEGRAWNEAYFLRAFLQHNSEFEIIYFNSFMEYRHRDLVEQKMPACLGSPGSSIWLRKKS